MISGQGKNGISDYWDLAHVQVNSFLGQWLIHVRPMKGPCYPWSLGCPYPIGVDIFKYLGFRVGMSQGPRIALTANETSSHTRSIANPSHLFVHVFLFFLFCEGDYLDICIHICFNDVQGFSTNLDNVFNYNLALMVSAK